MSKQSKQAAGQDELARLRAKVTALESECRRLRTRDGAAGPERSAGAARRDRRPTSSDLSDHRDEEPLPRMVDGLPIGLGYVGGDQRHRFANTAYGRLLGLGPDGVRQLPLADVFGHDAYQDVRPAVNAALSGKEAWVDVIVRVESGKGRRLQACCVPDLDADGLTRGCCIVLLDGSTNANVLRPDPDSRLDLYECSERLAKLGHFEWDEVADRATYCSMGLAELHGLSVDDYVAQFSNTEAGARAVHPDDRGRHQRVVAALQTEGKGFDIEYRTLRSDGEYLEVREVLEPVFDETGTLVRSIGYLQDISDLKRSERALSQSEKRFKDFADASSHWLWEMGPDLRFTYISDGITRVTGEDPADFIGKTRREIAGEIPVDANALRPNLEQMDRHEAFEDYLFERPMTTGGKVLLHLSGKPVHDSDGNFLGYRGTARDVTERMSLIETLRKTDALFKKSERLAKLGHWEWDELEDRCTYCSDELARLHGVSVEEYLEQEASFEADLEWAHPEDRERYKRVIIEAAEQCAGYEIEFKMLARDGSPLHVREVAEAILDEKGSLVKSIGSLQDITERKQAEEALRKTDALFKQAERLARLGHWEWDELADRCSYCSEELARLHGVSVEEYLEQETSFAAHLEWIHPEDRERYEKVVNEAADQCTGYEIEFKLLARDGSPLHIREVAEAVLDENGSLVKSIGTVQDVTERKQAEEALRQSEERFSGAFNFGLAGMAIFSPSGYFEEANKAYCDFLGYTAEELIGQHFETIIHPDDLDGVTERLERLRAGEVKGYQHERRYRHKDGRDIWGLAALSALHLRDGSPGGFIVQVLDITERKQAEDALRQSEALLRQATEIAQLGHWVWDEETDTCLYCSEGLARMNGMTVEEFYESHGTHEAVLADVHLDDRERYDKVVTEAARAQEPYEVEFRDLRPNGEYRYLRERGESISDESGKRTRTIGFIQDITKHKEAEAALRESEAALRESTTALAEAQRVAKLGHWHWPIEANELLSCSEEYARIHGVPYDRIGEHLKHQMEQVVHPDDRDRVIETFERVDEEGLDYEIDYRIVRPDGGFRHVHEIGEVVVDESGQAIAHKGTLQDITEQKLAEEALEKAHDELEQRVEDRTAELAEVNRALQLENTERKRAEQELLDSQIRLKDAIESISEAFILFDADERLILCNSKYREMFPAIDEILVPGTSLEHLVRAGAERGQFAEIGESTDEWVRERLRNYRGPQEEIELHTAEGRWILGTESRTKEGGIVAIRTDITERKHAEKARHKQEARLRQAHEIAKLGHWYLDQTSDHLTLSAELAALLRVPHEEVAEITTEDYLERFVHPSDRERVRIGTTLPETEGARFEIEYRLVPENGETRWVYEMGEAVLDDAGQHIAEAGAIQDITERKLAEQELRASRARFAGILDLAAEAVISVDQDQRVQLFNRAAAEIFGYSSEEMIGQPLDRLLTARHRQTHQKHITEFMGTSDVNRAMGARGEITGLRKSGSEFPLAASISKLELDGETILTVMLADITDTKRAHESLRQSEARLRHAQTMAKLGTFAWDDVKNCSAYCSEELAGLLGMSVEEYTERANQGLILNAVHPDDRDHYQEVLDAADNAIEPYDVEYRIQDAAGNFRYWREIGEPESDENGRLVRTFGTVQDITDMKLADEALRESEALLQAILDHAPAEIDIKDEEGRFILISKHLADVFGVTPEEAIGKTSRDFFPSELASGFEESDRYVLETGEVSIEETADVLEDGVHNFLVVKFRIPETVGGGAVVGGIATEITELRQREEALRESERRYREIFDDAPGALWVEDWSAVKQMVDRRAEDDVEDWREYFANNRDRLVEAYDMVRVLDVSNANLEVFGSPSKQAVLDMSRGSVVLPAELDAFAEVLLAFIEGKPRGVIESLDLRADGTEILLRTRYVIPPRYRHDWSRLIYTLEDVTERELAEIALRESAGRLRQATELAGLGYWIWDSIEDRGLFCSEETARIHGTTVEDYLARAAAIDGEWTFTHPDDRDAFQAAIGKLRSQGTGFDMEYRVATAGGETRYVQEIVKPVFDDSGRVIQEHGTIQDITDMKLAEEQLRQAQKMEAVGLLTSGMAHDINNLLFVIRTNLFLLEQEIDTSEEIRQSVEAIRSATEMGGDLTHSLLAFARKQPLAPVTAALPATIEHMIRTLFRPFAEQIDIETSFLGAIWPVRIDPHQLGVALLNLVLNAKDAMAEGSTLTIAVENYRPGKGEPAADLAGGEFVMLSVSDNGTGMPPEVVDQAFQPFVTTKPKGSGSGLGLSMVYGFVKQSGGHIEIESRLGEGTTIILYLPRAETDQPNQADELRQPNQPDELRQPDGVGEARRTILVTEDDEPVRRAAVKLLNRLGYRTLEAGDPDRALEILAEDPSIDLLFSDIVLNGSMDGYQLAARARDLRPDLKVVFCSGNSQGLELEPEAPETRAPLLLKPYDPYELERIIATVLDG